MTAEVLALTVYEPWASLIVQGCKPFEFRSWPAHSKYIDRRIVIHASAKPMRPETLYDARDAIDRQQEIGIITPEQAHDGLVLLSRAADRPEILPLGAGLGTAVLGVPTRRPDWDNWGWPMLEPEPFKEPIKAKGSQGFWVWKPVPSLGGHRCAAVGCDAVIPREKVMCFRHWVCVPRALQREIWRTVKSEPDACRMARQQAVIEVAEFEGRHVTEDAHA